MSSGPKGFADLADVPENERIRIIGEAATAGNRIAVPIDDDDEKVARYIRKITERFPLVEHIETAPFFPGVVIMSFRRKVD